MAFVINKSEYKSVFEQVNKTPGPGAYQGVETIKQDNPAPFNASSSKLSCFNVKQSNVGPGSYTIKSLNQCYKNKSTGSSSFKSQAPRFPYQSKSHKNIIEPPPQLYSQKSLLNCQNTFQKNPQSKFNQNKLNQKKQYLLNLRKRNQDRKINSIVTEQKSKIRILISNPKNTENIESFYIQQFTNIKQNNGPGNYDLSRSLVEKNKLVIDWSKDKQKRFKKSKSISSNIGPGYYQIDKKPKTSHHKRNTSSFSSGEVRTFLDTLVYKTNSMTKVQLMQSRGIKEYSPGPGEYSPQKPQKDSFYHGKQIMSSTVQRFTIDKNKTSIPGPGYYKNSEGKFKYQGLVKQMRQKIFGKQTIKHKDQKQQGFMSLEQELKTLKQQTKKDFYHIVPCTLKERCQSKAGTLSHQPRFKDCTKIKNKAPGPGQYLSLYQNKQPPENSSIFKSSTERQPFIINQQNIQKPFYDVGKQDIAVRTQKVRQNIKSLKKVAIEKPAFDSSVCRFPSQEISKTQPSTIPEAHNGVFYQRDQIDYDSFKPYKQKITYGSVFRSTTTRQPFTIKNNPGPGSYQYSDLLNKRSYNAQYYLIDRQKTLSTSKLQMH